MNLKSLIFLAASFFILKAGQPLMAWGERGHHLIGVEAAHLVLLQLPKTSTEKTFKYEKEFAKYLSKHRIQFGHSGNLPDISWRDQDEFSTTLNETTHYLNPEIIFGKPVDLKAIVESIKTLPGDYAQLLKSYSGKSSPLNNQPIDIYRQLGTAPYRAEQLFRQSVFAFQCARAKERESRGRAKSSATQPAVLVTYDEMFASWQKAGSPLGLPLDQMTAFCASNALRRDYLSASLGLLGVMGHFVGDLSQPYHVTANYDGWVTGNGGIHSYFETALVEAMPESFPEDVYQLSSKSDFASALDAKFEFSKVSDWTQKGSVASVLLKLSADSYSKISEVAALDDRLSIGLNAPKRRSQVIAWTDLASKDSKRKRATRKAADDSTVQEGFKPLITERLSIASRVLSRLFLEAYRAGSRPSFDTYSMGYLKYPLNLPFVLPTYDSQAVENAKKEMGVDSSSEDTPTAENEDNK